MVLGPGGRPQGCLICTHLYTSVYICTHLYTSVHICTHLYTSVHICTHLYRSKLARFFTCSMVELWTAVETGGQDLEVKLPFQLPAGQFKMLI